jgi:hypothetical protein
MKYSIFKLKGIVLLLALILVTPSAHAYIGPGTSSLLIQVLVGGVAAASILIKVHWGKFKKGINKLISVNGWSKKFE